MRKFLERKLVIFIKPGKMDVNDWLLGI